MISPGCAAGNERLHSFPDPAERRAAAARLIGNQLDRPVKCPAPPSAVHALDVESAYDPEDPTQSKVLKAREEAYRRNVETLRNFTTTANDMADQYIGIRPRDGRIALCLSDWLDTWARQNGILGSVTRQGNAERKWNLVALTLDYALIADAPEVDPARRKRIEAWFERLAHAWIEAPDWSDGRPNNHLNWAALALMSTGAVTGDRDLFERGLAVTRQALDQIAPDGSLPLEMERGSRALNYHVYALTPLVVAAAIASANGIDLYTERDGALHRLANFVAGAILDPRIVESRAHAKQERQDASLWGWAVAYLACFRDPKIGMALSAFGREPFRDPWLGGMVVRFGAARSGTAGTP
jgi:poly(beta-D-mannuronate) lyase